jgi:nitrate reductase assembly molybdenum cofactor insertion protein NarJ
MLVYKLLSALLEYPSAELKKALPEIQASRTENKTVDSAERAVMEKFLQWLDATDLTELQAGYVQKF